MSVITVGVDGSPESLAAGEWAAREAARRDASLRLVHAEEPWGPACAPLGGLPAPSAIDVRGEWAAHLLAETESRLTKAHPELRVTARQAAEQAVPVLLRAAEDGELLVLGSRGLGTVTGFLVGSVALAVVARAERPVVLVRAGQRAEGEHLPDASGTASVLTPYRDVVLALDLEHPADAVVEFAFEAARRRAAGLRVVHGRNPAAVHGYGAALDAGLNEELAAEARNALTDVLRPWREEFPGVEVRKQSVIGCVGRHLVHASHDASLVVVGRENRRTPVGRRIGPVTHAVLHHAHAPVAVVPHD